MRLTLPLIALLSLLVATSQATAAGGIVISSGSEAGYYDAVAGRLLVVLDREPGVPPEMHNSEGSLQNLERLFDPASPVNVGLTQSDALKSYLDAHAGASADDLAFLADIGRECAFVVTSTEGGVQSMGELKAGDGHRIAIPTEQSGAGATFEVLQGLDPAFERMQVVRIRSLEALLQLRSGGSRNVDAAFFVQRPRAVPPIEIVLENQKTFRFVPIRKDDVPGTTLPDGRPVYRFETVKLGFGKDFSATVDTMCTHGLLVGSKSKLSGEQIDTLMRALASSGSYILPGRR